MLKYLSILLLGIALFILGIVLFSCEGIKKFAEYGGSEQISISATPSDTQIAPSTPKTKKKKPIHTHTGSHEQ